MLKNISSAIQKSPSQYYLVCSFAACFVCIDPMRHSLAGGDGYDWMLANDLYSTEKICCPK
jgi:hypothetical protein